MNQIHVRQIEPASTKTLDTHSVAATNSDDQGPGVNHPAGYKGLAVRGSVSLRVLVPELWKNCPVGENEADLSLPLFDTPVIEPDEQPQAMGGKKFEHPPAHHSATFPAHAVLLLIAAAVATVMPLLIGDVTLAAAALAVVNLASAPAACAACHRARRHCQTHRCWLTAIVLLVCIGAALALLRNIDRCDPAVPETVGAGLIALATTTANRRI